MARDRDSDASGANQSKKPAAPFVDLGDQPQQQQQPPPQQHHRVKPQKHVVGGATGARLHARIPSSKALSKYHAVAASKLTRKHGSVSPERGAGAVLHRRTTSELKLARDTSSTNLKRDSSHSNLKRNRSHIEAPKRSKSAAVLQRSVSNPTVNKLKGNTRVQFNLGDDDEDDQDEDEWVDASGSASPYLSRRGSTVSSAHNQSTADGTSQAGMPGGEAQNGTDLGTKDKSSTNLYLTSRILSRTPSHGAPPMMTAETASARPPSIRNQSPPGSSAGQSQRSGDTPSTSMAARPGSSGKAELTSRFVGHNSQDAGSGTAGESFMAAASRAADGFNQQRRRQSEGALSQARGIDALNARQAAAAAVENSDDEKPAERRSRRGGESMNRTQQKLNLQRASSGLEAAQPHAGLVGAGAGAGVGALLAGVPINYDSRDPRIARTLERTGMEYLTVRRHLNPVARSISRIMQLPGMENSRRIPQPASGSSVSTAGPRSRLSSEHGLVPSPSNGPSSMADLMNGGARRPTTPRSVGGGGFSNLQSASSSFGTEDDRMANSMHERRRSQSQGPPESQDSHGSRLSGSSLLDGAEDAGTVALLRMMWDKSPLELSASH